MHLRRALRKAILVVASLSCLIGQCDIFGQSPDCAARNVIFFIGDGMGLAQVSYLAYSQNSPIALESFPVIGMQKTHSASDLITDSGAAATAFACGIKTYNSAIGMTVDTVPCTNLFELAKAQDKLTGIVVTSSVVHATPAAFAAHQVLRGFYEEIAEDMVSAEVDYLVGGGQMYFTNRFNDDRNLIEEMRESGWTVSGYDKKSFGAFSARTDARMAYFTAYSEPLPKMQGRENLSDVVVHALNVLSTYEEEGFLLMVEGSQIDFAGHGNNAYYLLTELKDMDDAILTALEFASGRDDTLIIVTGDHESGGLSIGEAESGKKVNVEFTTHNHTETMVPVFAYGPCAQLFGGIYENTEIFQKIVAAAGYE